VTTPSFVNVYCKMERDERACGPPSYKKHSEPIKSICDFHILDTKSDHFMELSNKYSDLYQL